MSKRYGDYTHVCLKKKKSLLSQCCDFISCYLLLLLLF